MLLFPAIVRADEPLEYKLAVIDAKGHIPEDHITVARFRSLLDQLSATFVEDRSKIAAVTVKGQEILREKGIEEKMLRMMEGTNRLFLKPFPNQKYSEYLSAYVVLRVQGETHDEALEGLRALLEGLGIR